MSRRKQMLCRNVRILTLVPDDLPIPSPREAGRGLG